MRSLRTRILTLTVSAFFLLFPPAGHRTVSAAKDSGSAGHASLAAGSELEQADSYRRESEDIRREIKIHEKKLDTTARRETDMIAELDRVQQQIQQVRRRSTRLDQQLAELDRRIASADAASSDLAKRIDANEGYLSRRLAAWYKFNRLGQIHVLASATDIVTFMQRKRALAAILTQDEKVRQTLLGHQRELKRLQDQLAADRRDKQQRAVEKQRQLDLLSKNLKTRSGLLTEVRRRKDLQLALVQELHQAADRLDHKFASLGRQQLSLQQPSNAKPKPFSDFKGLLKMPVEGNIINLFGPYTNPQFNVTNFRSGIDIETDRGEPVRVVHTGKIMYASWFKGYGNMIIVDHGANYYTVYAHVEEMFKAPGDWVQAGDVIATVGDTGSMSGARLYFEIRHHGKPVDPVEWLK